MDSTSLDRSSAVRLFLDCGRCDQEYIRSEITYVNYVRDRNDAHVHLLITSQQTGGGGKEYTETFIGQLEYAGSNDTLRFTTKQSDTDDMVRKELVRVAKVGLMRYVAKTPLAEHIEISFNKPASPTAVVDPWNNWVFRTRINTYFNGEKSRSYISVYGNVSANRVTPDSKLHFSANFSHDESKFEIDDEILRSIGRGKGGRTNVVFSVSDHWSAGVFGNVFSSTFDNVDVALFLGPAIEYDLFPYSESTNRQLRLSYSIKYVYGDYDEETIYDKTIEHLAQHELTVALEMKQTWGSVSATLEGSNFLHDFKKNKLDLFSQLSIRIMEGLSLDVFGSVSYIHDQLSLPKGSATTEEILLQRRALETQYRYFGSVGLSYTFGSIFNNVVNPRFGN